MVDICLVEENTLLDGRKEGRMERWVDGNWMEAKAVLRIAYSNQKLKHSAPLLNLSCITTFYILLPIKRHYFYRFQKAKKQHF